MNVLDEKPDILDALRPTGDWVRAGIDLRASPSLRGEPVLIGLDLPIPKGTKLGIVGRAVRKEHPH
ncbi:MAG: hypothetical protein Ct9H300mP7_4520 [Verrucomicrobiota bacterium]|nr:MAG: hypothetical protein Ct9H300mP7_4520 [Verrucomicrobiota bacterium]